MLVRVGVMDVQRLIVNVPASAVAELDRSLRLYGGGAETWELVGQAGAAQTVVGLAYPEGLGAAGRCGEIVDAWRDRHRL